MRLKRSKERSDAVENLQRHTVSGLRHICDLLGASESEDDTHVAEMVRANIALKSEDIHKKYTSSTYQMELFSVLNGYPISASTLGSIGRGHACLWRAKRICKL